MAKSLSVDLRKRVIVAIEAGALCRQAATRFGISASSATRWHRLSKDKGDVMPQLQGGDRQSKRIEAHADAIMAELAEARDIMLADLCDTLAWQGVAVSIPGPGRFFVRRRITLKITWHATEQDRPDVLMHTRHCSRISVTSICKRWCLSTIARPTPRRHHQLYLESHLRRQIDI